MSPILKMESDLIAAWALVQGETDLLLREQALRIYKEKLAVYLKHKLLVVTMAKLHK